MDSLEECPFRSVAWYTGSAYVPRAADRVLMDHIRRNDRYPYFLAPRQSGKSSLLIRACAILRGDGFYAAHIDLSKFRPDDLQDYDAFFSRASEHATRETGGAVELAWRARGLLTDWAVDVAERLDRRFIIVFDEIDQLLHCPEAVRIAILSNLRATFQERGKYPALSKLQFVLSGAAPKEILIPSEHLSPFNIGEKVLIADLDLPGVEAMVGVFRSGSYSAPEWLAKKVFEWTAGSVFLSQLILERLWRARQPSAWSAMIPGDVDAIVEEVARRPGDNVHFTYVRREMEARPQRVTALLDWLARRPLDAPQRDDLEFAGISMAPDRPFRNRIYERVFGPGGSLEIVRADQVLSIPAFLAGMNAPDVHRPTSRGQPAQRSAPEINPTTFSVNIAEAIEFLAAEMLAGKLAVVVGPTASAAAGFGLWQVLDDHLRGALNKTAKDLDDVPALADMYLDQIGEERSSDEVAARNQLIDEVESLKFRIGIQPCVFGPLYPRLAWLPVYDWFTTNWDPFLRESLRAVRDRGDKVGVLSVDESALKARGSDELPSKCEVVYLHGNIPGHRKSLIIARRDYQEIKKGAPNVVRRLERLSAAGFTFLCIGISYGQLHEMRYLTEAAAGRVYALLPGLSASDRQSLLDVGIAPIVIRKVENDEVQPLIQFTDALLARVNGVPDRAAPPPAEDPGAAGPADGDETLKLVRLRMRAAHEGFTSPTGWFENWPPAVFRPRDPPRHELLERVFVDRAPAREPGTLFGKRSGGDDGRTLRERIKDKLREGKSAGITGLVGIGGIGKTYLAMRVAWELREVEGWDVVWVTLLQQGKEEAADALADAYRLRFRDKLSLDEKIAALNALFATVAEECPQTLVVLDNAERFPDLGWLLTGIKPLPVLVTSRTNECRDIIDYHAIGSFRPSESIDMCKKFLDKRLPGWEKRFPPSFVGDELDQLCSHLGDHPLGIKLALSGALCTPEFLQGDSSVLRKQVEALRQGSAEGTTDQEVGSMVSNQSLQTKVFSIFEWLFQGLPEVAARSGLPERTGEQARLLLPLLATLGHVPVPPELVTRGIEALRSVVALRRAPDFPLGGGLPGSIPAPVGAVDAPPAAPFAPSEPPDSAEERPAEGSAAPGARDIAERGEQQIDEHDAAENDESNNKEDEDEDDDDDDSSPLKKWLAQRAREQAARAAPPKPAAPPPAWLSDVMALAEDGAAARAIQALNAVSLVDVDDQQRTMLHPLIREFSLAERRLDSPLDADAGLPQKVSTSGLLKPEETFPRWGLKGPTLDAYFTAALETLSGAEAHGEALLDLLPRLRRQRALVEKACNLVLQRSEDRFSAQRFALWVALLESATALAEAMELRELHGRLLLKLGEELDRMERSEGIGYLRRGIELLSKADSSYALDDLCWALAYVASLRDVEDNRAWVARTADALRGALAQRGQWRNVAIDRYQDVLRYAACDGPEELQLGLCAARSRYRPNLVVDLGDWLSYVAARGPKREALDRALALLPLDVEEGTIRDLGMPVSLDNLLLVWTKCISFRDKVALLPLERLERLYQSVLDFTRQIGHRGFRVRLARAAQMHWRYVMAGDWNDALSMASDALAVRKEQPSRGQEYFSLSTKLAYLTARLAVLPKGSDTGPLAREIPALRALIDRWGDYDDVGYMCIADALLHAVSSHAPVEAIAAIQRSRAAFERHMGVVPAEAAKYYSLVHEKLEINADAARTIEAGLSEQARQPPAIRSHVLLGRAALPARVRHKRDGRTMRLVHQGLQPCPAKTDLWMYPFYIDEHPVTLAELCRALDGRGQRFMRSSDADTDAASCAWEAASAYAEWAGKKLPNAHDWYAATWQLAAGQSPEIWRDWDAALEAMVRRIEGAFQGKGSIPTTKMTLPEPDNRASSAPLPESLRALITTWFTRGPDDRFPGVPPLVESEIVAAVTRAQPTASRALADSFARGLASTISLSLDERRRIIESFPKLKLIQFEELNRIFLEEQQKFLDLEEKHYQQVLKLIAEHFIDLVSILAPGAMLVAGTERQQLLGVWSGMMNQDEPTREILVNDPFTNASWQLSPNPPDERWGVTRVGIQCVLPLFMMEDLEAVEPIEL